MVIILYILVHAIMQLLIIVLSALNYITELSKPKGAMELTFTYAQHAIPKTEAQLKKSMIWFKVSIITI